MLNEWKLLESCRSAPWTGYIWHIKEVQVIYRTTNEMSGDRKIVITSREWRKDHKHNLDVLDGFGTLYT